MRVLIDTNVLLDYITKREPYVTDAEMIIAWCDLSLIQGCMAAHSISDMFYILRKDMSVKERKNALFFLCQIIKVGGIDQAKLLRALSDEDFSDFEDCLQYLCAKEFNADFIISRNPKDFESSSIPVISPDEFCRQFLKGERRDT